MFGLAMTFLPVALIAGALGFGAFVGTVFAAAKIVFVVALLAFLVSALVGYSRSMSRALRSRTPPEAAAARGGRASDGRELRPKRTRRGSGERSQP